MVFCLLISTPLPCLMCLYSMLSGRATGAHRQPQCLSSISFMSQESELHRLNFCDTASHKFLAEVGKFQLACRYNNVNSTSPHYLHSVCCEHTIRVVTISPQRNLNMYLENHPTLAETFHSTFTTVFRMHSLAIMNIFIKSTDQCCHPLSHPSSIDKDCVVRHVHVLMFPYAIS